MMHVEMGDVMRQLVCKTPYAQRAVLICVGLALVSVSVMVCEVSIVYGQSNTPSNSPKQEVKTKPVVTPVDITTSPTQPALPRPKVAKKNVQFGMWQLIEGDVITISQKQWTGVILRHQRTKHTIHAKRAVYTQRALSLSGRVRLHLNTGHVIAATSAQLLLSGAFRASAPLKRPIRWSTATWQVTTTQVEVIFDPNVIVTTGAVSKRMSK